LSLYSSLLRPALFSLDAEFAHGLAIAALRSGLLPGAGRPTDPRLRVSIAGLELPGPVGLAAGFDKNGEVADGMLAMGFGFVEIGSVTPRPQQGNPKPRMLRLPMDRGVINRLGFNNAGHEAVLANLRSLGGGGIVGVNLGANKDSADRIGDYVAGIAAMWPVASYFTVNVSSPNTPGLRNLQGRAELAELLARVLGRRDELATITNESRPVFLKIAPDLDDPVMDDIAGEIGKSGLDGLVVSNTTLARAGLSDPASAREAGGLSGRPLFERSTIILARMRQRLPELPIIGVGGIDSAETARAKIEAGADAVQLYTGMIFEGPRLATRIHREMAAMLDREGAKSIADWKGSRIDEWASRKVED